MRLFSMSLILLTLPAPALADLSGRVIAVHDGDTLTVLEQGRKVRVDLDGIDAPELSQRYGWAALTTLSRLCRGRPATVDERGKDEEGNVLGTVTCEAPGGKGGAKVEANAELVKRGLAWVYRTYLPLGSPLYELEANARLMQRGLWQDKDPVPPWDWRKQHSAPAAKPAAAAR
jgi:endonuclease YncB( thermonuclease family)